MVDVYRSVLKVDILKCQTTELWNTHSCIKKYDAQGEEGLTDKRGRHKTDDEVDELERLRRENARLKRQLQEKDMLAELLKKVQEFEGMWGLENFAMIQNLWQ